MRLISQVDASLKLPLPRQRMKTKGGRGGSGPIDYVSRDNVSLGMNEAFGVVGWDVLVDEVDIVVPPYRTDQNKREDPKGRYWNCVAVAKVTVVVRALQNGRIVTAMRQDVSAGQPINEKATDQSTAVHMAVTVAVSCAFKRASKYFGPRTGLTMGWDKGEREHIEHLIQAIPLLEDNLTHEDLMSASEAIGTMVTRQSNVTLESVREEMLKSEQVEGHEEDEDQGVQDAEDAEHVEDASDATDAATHDTPVANVPAQDDQCQQDADTGHSSDSPDISDPVVMRAVDRARMALAMVAPDNDLLNRILSTGVGGVSRGDLGELHNRLIMAYGGADKALEMWQSAGINPGPGTVVSLRDVLALAQAVEESMAPTAATQSPTEKDAGSDNGGNRGIVESMETNDPIDGIDKETWDVINSGDSDRITALFGGILGPGKDEIVSVLAHTDDTSLLKMDDANMLHTLCSDRLETRGANITDVFALWAKVGHRGGGGTLPNGRQARMFAAMIPR